MAPSIYLIGNVSDGFTAVGPFPGFDAAAEHADRHTLAHDTWVMTLTPPEELGRFKCQDCGALHDEIELNPVDDLVERVSGGERVPDGQCPRCGAVCHKVGP